MAAVMRAAPTVSVASMVRQHAISYRHVRIDIAARAQRRGEGVEAAGRRARATRGYAWSLDKAAQSPLPPRIIAMTRQKRSLLSLRVWSAWSRWYSQQVA